MQRWEASAAGCHWWELGGGCWAKSAADVQGPIGVAEGVLRICRLLDMWCGWAGLGCQEERRESGDGDVQALTGHRRGALCCKLSPLAVHFTAAYVPAHLSPICPPTAR